MAARIRDLDWGATSLGPIVTWSERLKLMVEQVLASPLVSSLVCGPEKVLVYNNAAGKLYGDRHPRTLGRPLPESFPEGWATVAHLYERAFAGETVQVGGQPLDTRGEGGVTDVFDALLTPVREADGRVAYVHMAGFEVGARSRAEAALRASEAHYRHLFDAIDEGFCTIEVLIDAAGCAVDYRFLSANAAFEQQTGLRDAVGRTMRELAPAHEAHWFETYGRIARIGLPERFEDRADALGRWYDVFAFRIGPPERRQVAILFKDILARGRAEQQVRESEERQAFLLKLSDALRPLSDAAQIQATTTQLLGAHLGADRAMYAEVTGEPGREAGVIRGQFIRQVAQGQPAPVPFPDHFTYETFGADVMARRYGGEGLAVADVNADPGFDATEREAWARVGVQAAIVAPLVKGDRLVAELGVHSETSRAWTDAEISLVREVGERTWAAAERARAEAASLASEERFRQFANASAAGLWIRDANMLAMEYVSPAIAAIYGTEPDALLGDVTRWAAMIVPDDRDVALSRLEAARAGKTVVHEFRIQRPSDGAFRWIRNTDFPLHDAHGRVQRIGGIAEDVTETMEMRERQGVLVGELQHRTRNLMGVVRAMADKTMARAADLADFQERFSDRLAALGRVQGLLSRLAEGERITFDGLIRAEMAAIDGSAEKVTLEGPSGVALRSSTVQTFALAMHELSTNAGKYGAFAQSQGWLDIRWRVERAAKDGKPWLHVDWRERGVAMPAKDALSQGGGSGRELIERALPYQLGAKTTYVMEADGVHCTIALPVSDQRQGREPADG